MALVKKNKFIITTLGINCVIWAYFWVSLFVMSEANAPGQHGYDPEMDQLVVAAYSLGPIQFLTNYTFIKVTAILQLPSVLTVGLFRYSFVNHIERTQMFGNFNFAGIMIVLVMVVSFLQWYLIGGILHWVVLRYSRKKSMA